MSVTNITEPKPQVAATPPKKGIRDLQQVDLILEEAEPHLAETLKALDYPEVCGLLDPKRQDRALKSLRTEIELVHDCMRRAKDLSEMAWFDE